MENEIAINIIVGVIAACTVCTMVWLIVSKSIEDKELYDGNDTPDT